MIEVIEGDLLDSKEQYIAHICNCVSQNSSGIARAIFDKFPYANTYANRIKPSAMRTIEVLGDSKEQRYVINMFAQYYPGKPKYPDSSLDGFEIREKAFYKCLLDISRLPNLESIAFPFNIGCGLAGGNWDYYLSKISDFASYISNSQEAKVVIYKKD